MTPKTTGWGYYVQGGEQTQLLDACASQLSIKIGCVVHYPAWNKRLFECECGVLFPVWMVEHAVNSSDWDEVLRIHNDRENKQVQEALN